MINYRVLYKMSESDPPFGGRSKNIEWYKYYEVREYKPCKRTISIGREYHFLPFPYIVFLSYGGKYGGGVFYAWFTTKSFKGDINQNLYMPFLPNIEHGGRVCLGDSGMYQKASIDNFIHEFWSKNFSSYDSNHCSPDAEQMLKSITSGRKKFLNIEDCLKVWAELSIRQVITRMSHKQSYMRFSRLINDWGANLC